MQLEAHRGNGLKRNEAKLRQPTSHRLPPCRATITRSSEFTIIRSMAVCPPSTVFNWATDQTKQRTLALADVRAG